MVTISIPLADIITDPTNPRDLTSLGPADTVTAVRELYAFLGPDVAVRIEANTAIVTAPPANEVSAKRLTRLADRAAKAAGRGSYDRAVSLYEEIVAAVPTHTAARRDLGMALLEAGRVAQAERHVIETLRLDPQDAYALLLLGNIYFKEKQDATTAERFYLRATAAAPADAYILANYGSLLAQREEYEAAAEQFRRALAADPGYPNAAYGLALVGQRRGDFAAAAAALEELFAQPESVDIRSEPVYAEARRLYLYASEQLARERHDAFMAYARGRRAALEEQGGVEIELVADATIATTAVAEIAWHHGRARHIVRYKDRNPLVTPHLLAHELEHIALEQAARDAERNRFFTTTEETRAAALRSISADVHQLKRKLGVQAEQIVEQFLQGLANQLFNAPLDMFIEQRLHEQHPRLRPSQFLSLKATYDEALPALEDPKVKQLSPRLIYDANVSMNAAQAIFIDHLYGGATDYAAAYQSGRHYRTGRELFSLWLQAAEDYQPGDEYLLVDQFAGVLRLQQWYQWRKDEPQLVEEAGGSTNEALLQQKMPAATMYCLSALQYFEGKARDEILRVVSEIALLGRGGLDYASAEKKYTLQSMPGRDFSGLELMSFMYVGFKDIDPTVDVGMDLRAAYEAALLLHEG